MFDTNSGQTHSPPLQGGVAAASIRGREATEEPQTGWSLRRYVSETHSDTTCERPPRPRLFGTDPFVNGASIPLLTKEGNAPESRGKHYVGHDTLLNIIKLHEIFR